MVACARLLRAHPAPANRATTSQALTSPLTCIQQHHRQRRPTRWRTTPTTPSPTCIPALLPPTATAAAPPTGGLLYSPRRHPTTARLRQGTTQPACPLLPCLGWRPTPHTTTASPGARCHTTSTITTSTYPRYPILTRTASAPATRTHTPVHALRPRLLTCPRRTAHRSPVLLQRPSATPPPCQETSTCPSSYS